MSDSIQDRVLQVIATTRRLPLESVTPDSTFEELGIDSLDRLNILFDLEGEFDIQIDDEEAKKVTNLHQMIDGVRHLIEAKANPSLNPASSPVEPPAAVAPSTVPNLPAASPAMPEPQVPLDPADLPSPFPHDPTQTED